MKKKFRILSCLILMSALLTAGLFKPVETAMDTEKVIVYQNESAEYFLIQIYSNRDYAKKHYHDQYFMMYGKIRSKDSANKQIKLAMVPNYSKETLTCNATKEETIQSIAQLRTGDEVRVYGKLSQGLLNGKWSMSIDKIEKTSEKEVSRTAYSVISGKTVDTEQMQVRSLNQDQIHFYIPKEWNAVETNLIDSGLGTMEGYQYRLNEINQESVQPESLFICYFNSDTQLLRTSDKSQTEAIEKAIVNNIIKTDPGKPEKKKTTYYGADYHYYQEAYKTALGQNYHAEFIFQPDGTNGLIVYLYVYREKKHIDDVMMVLRAVEP
ncbi:MAG: hypothetical protein E7295_14510 [Lachnospiraceae bacterium]|nr:hypothetical protein [Lachnospiraceae bacterium]